MTNHRPPRRRNKSPFRINLTVLAFFLVIFGSIASGVATGIASYRLGRASLSTVSTPTGNPTQNIPKAEENQAQKQTNQEFEITKEREILVRVYDFVVAKKEELEAQSPNQ